MLVKSKRQDGYSGDTAIGITINGSVVMNIFPKTSRGGRYYESDRFGKTYTTITEAKEHVISMVKEGYFKGEYKP